MPAAPMSRPAASAWLAGAILAAVLFTLTPAMPAWAHNTLRSASPARDTILTTAPTEIVLEFTGRLDPTFTTIVVSDPGKRRVATGEPVVTGTRGTVTLTPPLGNGTYTVAYRVVSTDGHPVQGSYPFTIADPRASAVPTDAPVPSSAAPAAGPAKPDKSPGAAAIAGGAALVLLAAAAGLLWWRRRARR